MAADTYTWRVRAMGTHFNFQVRTQSQRCAKHHREATERLLESMESSWSRFLEDSELSSLNRAGELAHPSTLLKLAVFEAANAYRLTGGVFDPRVKLALEHIGYSKSFTEIGSGAQVAASPSPSPRPFLQEFDPRLDQEGDLLSIGPASIDLGGIGKGLALRMLSDHLRHSDSGSHLIEAGGDIKTYLEPNDTEPWFVDVESPFSENRLPMLLRVGTAAIATSSTKVRNWTVDGVGKHHIIDPSTMDSSGSDICSVTVVDADSAKAEVLSKWLFVLGRAQALPLAEEREIAALVIGDDGGVAYSTRLARHMQVQAEGSTSASQCLASEFSSPLEPIAVTI